MVDLENNTINFTVGGIGVTALPGFINFTQHYFTFSPILFKDVGTHEINVTLNDGQPLYSSV